MTLPPAPQIQYLLKTPSTSSNSTRPLMPFLKLPDIILWSLGLALLRRKLLTIFKLSAKICDEMSTIKRAGQDFARILVMLSGKEGTDTAFELLQELNDTSK